MLTIQKKIQSKKIKINIKCINKFLIFIYNILLLVIFKKDLIFKVI